MISEIRQLTITIMLILGIFTIKDSTFLAGYSEKNYIIIGSLTAVAIWIVVYKIDKKIKSIVFAILTGRG